MTKKWLDQIFRIDVLIIALIILSVAGYIFHLKTASQTRTVFVEAKLQRADWWSSRNFVLTELIAPLTVDSYDQTGTAQITSARFFPKINRSDWQEVENKSIGTLTMQIEALVENGHLFYQGQELLIGNPLNLTIGGGKFELLLTKVQTEKPLQPQFIPKSIIVRVYNRPKEYYRYYQPQMTLTDHAGNIYATLLSTKLENTVINTVDQFGQTHRSQDKVNYDVIAEVSVLVEEGTSPLQAYDGTRVEMGAPFIFHHPLLGRFEGYITDIIDD